MVSSGDQSMLMGSGTIDLAKEEYLEIQQFEDKNKVFNFREEDLLDGEIEENDRNLRLD